MKVKELMTQDSIILKNKEELSHGAELLINHDIDVAPVVDEDGKIINIITKNDLIKAFIDGIPLNATIDKISSKNVQTINQNTNILDAWNLNVRCLPVVDNEDKLVGMLTHMDLTNELFQRESREANELKIILESTNNGIIIIDKEAIITNCNPSAMRILNLNRDKIIGLNIQHILPELKLHEIIQSGRRIITEKIKFKDKILICDRIPLFNDRQISGGIIVFKDGSELESIIEELNIAERLTKKLDAVIESSYDGIYITDGKANTLRINRSYERITGVKIEEMLGKNMRDLEKEGCISESATLMVLKNRKTTTIQQKFRTGKNALVTSTPIFCEKGEIMMVVTNVRDITELSKLREQLRANRELTQKYYSEIEEMRMQNLRELDIVSEDESMLKILRIGKRVAKLDTTVLLLGETGVGKEEVAKFIHKNSKRNNKSFIKVNCGAIPENLIESELFGYEKGAFTGANKEGKVGLLEVADGGTFFLDEVGELCLDMQVKLLRTLQDGEITRVGGVKPVKIDVRILAATNRNLEEMVKKKLFREDLYYRLNVVPLLIPPLRERRQDIIPLVRYFLLQFNQKYSWNKSFSGDALDYLYDYYWPGNIRELKNIVERAIVISNNNNITSYDLSKIIDGNKKEEALDIEAGDRSLKDMVAQLENRLISKAYENHGNVRAAAKSLGIDASTFVRKRKKYEGMNKLQNYNFDV
ncbi:sigma 54-interacting transcriptional regulator [Wukongibacter sp. M2B1]|uniref:sigma 54-interacting transcriptional regulator n=1 Tax=Wukongibacter sp. M2B1 TaxID=3088895 RepID=UPI003D7A804B